MESPVPPISKDGFESDSESEKDENRDTFNDSVSKIIKISDSAAKKEKMGNDIAIGGYDSVVSKLPRNFIRFDSLVSNDPKRRASVLLRM